MSAGETIHTASTGGQKAGNDVRASLIPTREHMEVAELYGKGAKKYDAHNWTLGYEWSKSYDALQRHLSEFWSGNEIDDGEGGTGLQHLACAAFHVYTLMYFSKHHRALDDRHIAPAQPVGTIDPAAIITSGAGALIFDINSPIVYDSLIDTSLWTITGSPSGAEGVQLSDAALSSWTVPEYTPHYPWKGSRAVRLTDYLRGSQWQSEDNGCVYWFVENEWWCMHPDDESEDPWEKAITENDGVTVPSDEGPFIIYTGDAA